MLPVLEAYLREGTPPRAHHSRWREASGIDRADRSRFEHETLCSILESALVYDQLNVPSLASMELLIRRVQLIEDAHSGNPLHPSYERSHHFLGRPIGERGAVVDPALSSHVAQRLQAEAAVAKERRKQREERTLAKVPKGKAPPAEKP